MKICLDRWAETEGGSATLINLSENHTFRIDMPDGSRYSLRVHRPGYQSAASIESELEWLAALRRQTKLPVPQPLVGRDGQMLQTLQLPDEAARHAVLFAFEAGVEPRPQDDLGAIFETLGRFAAIAHEHAIGFEASPGFVRQIWTTAAILDPDGLWGDWREAPYVAGEVAEILAALDHRLRIEIAAYGDGADRFGLIHADMRLANVLVDGGQVTLIDFDDCGLCWFLYDFAAAVSFIDDARQISALRERWLLGYGTIRSLSSADLAIIDALVLLRRMALLAWIGSHNETELARKHARDFARVTAEMGARYLAGES